MQNVIQKIMVFMQGRYGTDKLNNVKFFASMHVWFVNLFVFDPLASLILTLIEIAIFAWFLFRALSRNITKRSAENRKFLPLYNAVSGWFKLTVRKFKDRKEFKYLKCPSCKAQLRVKRKKGNHTVKCPKCASEFDKKIR